MFAYIASQFPFGISRTKTTEVDELMEKIKALELERDAAILSKQELQKEVYQLKNELSSSVKPRIREYGARVGVDRSCADAICKNCESKDHKSGECPNPPYLRNRDMTVHGEHFPTGMYSFIGKLPGPTAGEIISKFESKFAMEFSRAQIQVVYAFLFFDHVCFGCFSPFHDVKDCRCRRSTDPGAKKIARLMHFENHPLSPEKIERRIEKFRIYGKH